jgi:uncharacterized membrane protein
MRPHWRRWLGGSFFFFPPVMHLLIVRGMIAAALIGLALVSLAALAAHLSGERGRFWEAIPYGLVGLAALASLAGGRALALYLPPIVFNLALALAFGRTLRAGATPLIERYMRAHHGEDLSPALARYGRQLTWAWAIFFVSMALTAVTIALFAPLETWSLFANVVNYLLVAALFVAQFVYGYLRHRTPRLEHLLPTVVQAARRTAGRAVRR